MLSSNIGRVVIAPYSDRFKHLPLHYIKMLQLRTLTLTSFSLVLASSRKITAPAFAFVGLQSRRLDRSFLDPRAIKTEPLYSKANSRGDEIPFRYGQKIQVEVASFGPLGASVDVIGIGHSPEDLIPESAPPLGNGLVLQQEIRHFREVRGNVDVVHGEVLRAYIERIRDDGKLDISLRVPGGKAKAKQVGEMILEKLEWSEDGTLPVGDKSAPKEIAAEFPGVSKSSFKKAVSSLYKKGLVKPGPYSISTMN